MIWLHPMKLVVLWFSSLVSYNTVIARGRDITQISLPLPNDLHCHCEGENITRISLPLPNNPTFSSLEAMEAELQNIFHREIDLITPEVLSLMLL